MTIGAAVSGGAIFNTEELIIERSTITGNSASMGGGAIYSANGSLVRVSNTTISNNTAANAGGGIAGYSAGVRVTDSTISGNSASFGGGLFGYGTNFTLDSSTISGNRADTGGGVYAPGGLVNVNYSTVTDNSATRQGGGIAFGPTSPFGTLNVTGAIVAGNSANGMADDILPGQASPTSGYTINYSLVGTNANTGLAPTMMGNLIGGTGGDVIDPKLGRLGYYGGATQTHLPAADSPAVDAGNMAAVAGQNGVPMFSQAGNRFSRVAGGAIDMGSMERQSIDTSSLVVNSILFDRLRSEIDLSDLSLREAISIANGSVGADTITLADYIDWRNYSIDLTRGELTVAESLTIMGQPNATIDAQGNSRIFRVRNDYGYGACPCDYGTFTIDQLTLTGGKTVQ